MPSPGWRLLPEAEIDLVRAALSHCRSAEYPDMDLEEQLGLLDSLAAAAARRIGDAAEPLTAVNRLSEYLFDEVGFYGNEQDYYNPRNSFLNDVLSRRTGIPIALSLVCIAVGERCGVPLVAVGLPGHLVIRHEERRETGSLIPSTAESCCPSRNARSGCSRCPRGRCPGTRPS